jgi:putative heme-binding domain-containing protein
MGRPDADTADSYMQGLDRHYPADNEPENRELSQLLVFLEAPDVVGKTLALLDAAPTQEEQIYYITVLRNLKKGWSLEQHRHYFAWFQKSRANLAYTGDTLSWYREAGRDYADGASFANFMKRIHRDAVDTLSDEERGELAGVISGRPAPIQAPVVERKFVKDWKMDDLLPSLGDVAKGRSFAKGKEVFTAAQCLACHRFGNEGGAVGPDLTAVFTRFTRRDVLESIIEPSKVVSEQYQNQNLTLKDGDIITGRIVEETAGKYGVIVNPLTQTRIEVNKTEVVKKEASKVSPMPEGLLSLFTRGEILDLMAYIESAGKAGAPIYKNN